MTMEDKIKKDTFEEKVKKALEKIRPFIQADGGDIELVEVDEKNKNILIKFLGACANCAMLEITLKYGIEEAVREEIPDINKIISL
jgi:Fe-S cluster biogenesis protein NfuA